MKNNTITLEKLTTMSGSELAQFCDQGREYRRMANRCVLNPLAVPEGWRGSAEEESEFCGQVPVLCRLIPDGNEAIALYLASAGEDNPCWTVFFPFNDGKSLAWLYQAERFDPEVVNTVLAVAAQYYLYGFLRPEKLATALYMGGHCV